MYIEPLDYLKLYLDFYLLPSQLHKKNWPQLHRKSLVKAIVHALKIKVGRILPAVSLNTLVIAVSTAFFTKM